MNRVEFLTKLLDACEATPYVAQAAQVDVIMVYDALTAEVTALRARVAELEAEARWVSAEERLPELNEVGWSDYVQLAYKVIGCDYHGQQIVSRVCTIRRDQSQKWEYGVTNTLEDYGYEAVAWRELPAPPEAE